MMEIRKYKTNQQRQRDNSELFNRIAKELYPDENPNKIQAIHLERTLDLPVILK